MKISIRFLTSVVMCLLSIITYSQDWQSLGPNRLPKGDAQSVGRCAGSSGNGAFFTIAAEPDNYQNIYASGNNSGVRRSLSTNTQWEAVNNGFTEVSHADKIVIDRQKRNGNYSMYACNQWGMFRSDNHGSSWSLTGFNTVIDPANYNHSYFPTYDPNDEKVHKISEFDIASHATDADKSGILANLSYDALGEENHLIYYDLGTGNYKNLTSVFLNMIDPGAVPVKYRYSDIIAFPDNVANGTKKFYVKVDRFDIYYDANQSKYRPYLDAKSIPAVVQSFIYILEITISQSSPYINETWTDLTPTIYGAGHLLPKSNALNYANIEVMNSPSCSTYLFAFVRGTDASEQNTMLMSNNYGINNGNGAASWQKCMGDYNSLETDPSFGGNGSTTHRPPLKFAVSEKLNNGLPQYIYFYWSKGNWGKAFKTEINNTNLPLNLTVLPYQSLFSPYCIYDNNNQRNTGQFHPDQRDIEIIGDNNNEAIYISDDGGIAVSYNEGTSFDYVHNSEGLNAAHINGISVSEDGQMVAAGFHHSSINYYGMIQNDWVCSDQAGDGGEVIFDPLNKDRVFIQSFGSTGTSDIHETYLSSTNPHNNSYDLCNCYITINNKQISICKADENRPMQLFSSENELYCGYSELFASKIINNTWTGKKISAFGIDNIRDIYVSPDKTKMYFIASGPTWDPANQKKKIFRNFTASGYNTGTGLLTSGNGNWEDITDKFTNGIRSYCVYNNLGGMVVDPVNYQTIYIALKEYSLNNSGATRPDRVFKSINGGDTWTSISTGLPTYAIHKIILDKATETLYIGTSGGVYSYSNGTWQEYNPTNPALGKLPKCLVIDLEINQKTRKLYVGAEGYGVWVTDLSCPNTVSVQQISQNEIWGEQSISSEIEIQSGYTLTIAGNLYCTPNVKITVFPGAKLIIDGAKISNIGACSINNWLGIILLGDQYHPQDPAFQGVVELKNGAIIENAINGIIVGDYNNGALNGGIIKADNATFLNCKRDVEFLWYTNAKSTSYFKNCVFKCTQILPNNNGYGTGDYVTLSGIQGVSFSGCTWECVIPSSTPPTNDNRGRGVFGIDFSASFENADNGVGQQVNPNCLLTAGPGCVFKNLTKGIEFERDNQDYHIYVRGATFENNGVGIDMYGSHTTSQAPKGCVIWGNEFKWNASCTGGMPTSGAYAGVRTGMGGNLKFDNFYIDNNTFTIDQQVPQNIGITIICTDINNSGNYYHSEVFENTCTNNQTTNLYHTALRIQLFNDKLELQCGNHYSGFDHDWKITGGTASFSLKDQGVTSTNNACTNIFTTGKPANIYVLYVTPPMTNHYFRKTASAYNVTTNSTTYLSPNLTLGVCSPADPCNIGGYTITNGGGNGEGLGFAPNMKPKMDWKNKNELYNGGGTDFYSLDNNNQIKIRPNPANEQIDILYNLDINDGSMGEISIINTDGKLVKKESVYALASIKTIDIANLANGIYHVILNQNGKLVASSKLVVVH